MQEDILATFMKLGSTAAMVRWARRNQTDFYTKLYAKLIPLQVQGDPDNPLYVAAKIDVTKLSDEELEQVARQIQSRVTKKQELDALRASLPNPREKRIEAEDAEIISEDK